MFTLFGCQLGIAGEFKDCLCKPNAISIAYDASSAVAHNAGQFTVRIANKNRGAPSGCNAVILAGNDQALEIGLQGYQGASRRLLGIAHALGGTTVSAAAQAAGMERQALGDAIKRYNAEGLEGYSTAPSQAVHESSMPGKRKN